MEPGCRGEGWGFANLFRMAVCVVNIGVFGDAYFQCPKVL